MAKGKMFKPLPASGTPQQLHRRGEWRSLWPVPRDAPPAPDVHPTLGIPSAVYTYRTASGELAGYVCRFEMPEGGKEFRPLTYCEHSRTGVRDWRWKGFAPPRPLYGLDRLASRPDAPVIVCEGEKAADTAAELLPGYVAVTSPGGSNGAAKADWGMLARRRVIIWPDNDEPGRGYAEAVARCLAQASASVSIVMSPAEAPPGWDAADAARDGWDEARASTLVEAATPADDAMHEGDATPEGPASDDCDGTKNAGNNTTRRGGKKGGRKRRPPQRNLLLEASGDVQLWHTPERDAFASVPVNGHVEHWEVRSRDFRLWLTQGFYADYGGAPGSQALQDALSLLEARAIFDGLCYPVWRRVGKFGGAIYLDLCDEHWRAIEITPDGWRMVDSPPVKLIRSSAMQALPEPEGGEPIEHLRGFVNVETDADFKLVVGWLVAAMRPDGPYPILIINGEQGSAKSTTAKIVQSLIDPNAADARSMPINERDLFISAFNNWCLSFDNLSGISGWISDAWCRISTGGGFATRELHSDRREIVLNASRPIILNGIGGLDARPDLGDRAFIITSPSIAPDARRTEEEIWTAFHAQRPSILGALCDAVSSALRRKGEVKLSRKLRMADVALWIEAAEPGLGWESGSFNRAYAENQKAAVLSIIDDNPVAQAIRALAEDRGEIEGSASEILPMLNDRVSEAVLKQRSWPKSPSSLGTWLKRLSPVLRATGMDVRFERVGRERRRLWTIAVPSDGSVDKVSTSQTMPSYKRP